MINRDKEKEIENIEKINEEQRADTENRIRKLEAVERSLKQILQGIINEKALLEEAKKYNIDRYTAILAFSTSEPNLYWELMLEDISVLSKV